MSQRTRHPLASVAVPAGRDQPLAGRTPDLTTRVLPLSHAANPAKGLASYLLTLSETGTADVVAAAVRERLTNPDSGWLTARPSGSGVVIRSATARVTVRPGMVAVEGWGRAGFSSGQTDGLLAACPPQARGSRFPFPHSVLEGLAAGSTFTTVALAVHIAGLLSVCGDGVAIPDRWLAGRLGVDPGTLRRHRPLLQSAFRIERDNTASVWRYHRRDWSFDEGVTWIPSGVLTRSDLRPVDVAVLVGWLSWADYQGRMKGTWAVVADRARVHRSTVVRTVARHRRLGLVAARRLRTELLRDPHWREDLRDAQAAAERRAGPRCLSSSARSVVPLYSISQLCSKDLSDSLALQGADCAMQKSQGTEKGGLAPSDTSAESTPLPETYRWETPQAPKRVHVPDWPTLQALIRQPEWAGPALDQVRGVARRAGWQEATAAALEVDWRIATLCPPRYPSALARVLALCYADHCPTPASHGGDCGPAALVAHAARRLDDDNWRIRVRSAGAHPPPPAAYQTTNELALPPPPAAPPPEAPRPAPVPHSPPPRLDPEPAPLPSPEPQPLPPPSTARWQQLRADAPPEFQDLVSRVAARFEEPAEEPAEEP